VRGRAYALQGVAESVLYRGQVAVVAATLTLGLLITGCSGIEPDGEQQQPAVANTMAPGKTTVPLCGLSDVAPVTGPLAALPDDIVRPLVPDVRNEENREYQTFTVTGDVLATLHSNDQSEAIVTLYDLDGDEQDSFTANFGPAEAHEVFRVSSVAVDQDGFVYLPDVNGQDNAVTKYSEDGKEVWRTDVGGLGRGPISAVFPWSDAGGAFVIAMAFGDSRQTAFVGSDGRLEPDGPFIDGSRFHPQPTGELVTTPDGDVGYIERYSRAGDRIDHFGSGLRTAATGRTGAPMPVGRAAGVAPAPDDGYLIATNGLGLLEVTEDGLWQTVAPDRTADPDAGFVLFENTPLIQVDDRYVFATEGDNRVPTIVAVATADMPALLSAPSTYDAGRRTWQAVLGYGAGLVTGAPFNYFGPHEAPAVEAYFDPWWSEQANRFDLRYRVSGDPRREPPIPETSGTLEIPPTGGHLALDLPLTEPGAYEVHAELVERTTGDVVSSTCLNYAVGGPASRLDFNALADGADWGGPRPVRGVQLADQLGVGSYRWQLDFGRIVPHVDATPSESVLAWDSLPGAEGGPPFAEIARAAALARHSGVRLILQVGSGGDAETHAVENGTWGAWVREIAAAFAASAPDAVLWAPWNEPNNTGFSDGSDYADHVLEPFADAIKESIPSAQVIGGNSLGVVPDWWEQVVAAGGCAALDIVSIHPYTGLNASWDEEGDSGPIGQISQLRDVLAECEKPIWNTESGWWSDGPANFWAQADDVVRSYLWMRNLGVDEWTYFFSEGGFGEGGVSWSLIQHADYVKPGALAFMTASSLLEGRPTPELVDTTIPFIHLMRIGAPPGGSDDLLAVWTDDIDTTLELRSSAATAVDVTRYDVYGGTSSVTVEPGQRTPIRVTGSVSIFQARSDAGLSIAAVNEFGSNLLRAGKATASSTADGYSPENVLRDDAANISPWLSGAETADGDPDVRPWLQVDLEQSVEVNRIAVATRGIRCCKGGLRDYTVSIRDPAGDWIQVAEQHDQFFERVALFTFDPVSASAVRIDVASTIHRGVEVPKVNYSGQVAGLHPAWWLVDQNTVEAAAITAVTAYAPAK
jgi:F5/8 type C domain